MAEELRVNRNTVDQAYLEQEQRDVIETRAGTGCFVSDNHSPPKEELPTTGCQRGHRCRHRASHHFQITDEELLELIRKRIKEFRDENPTTEE